MTLHLFNKNIIRSIQSRWNNPHCPLRTTKKT